MADWGSNGHPVQTPSEAFSVYLSGIVFHILIPPAALTSPWLGYRSPVPFCTLYAVQKRKEH